MASEASEPGAAAAQRDPGLAGRCLRTVVILVTLLCLAIVSAIVAGSLAVQYYRRWSEVRLNPVHPQRYKSENSTVGIVGGTRIVFFGDSRIEQWQPRPDLEHADSIWRGIAGETTSQMLYRFQSDAIDLHPAAVVIQGGINDLVSGVATGQAEAAADGVVANLSALANSAARAGADVYLLTIVRPAEPPLWRWPVWSDSIYGVVDAVNNRLRELRIDNMKIVDADGVLATGERVLPRKFAADTLHFSVPAYEALNRELSRQLRTAPHALQ